MRECYRLDSNWIVVYAWRSFVRSLACSFCGRTSAFDKRNLWEQRMNGRRQLYWRHLPFIYDVVEWILITINIYNHWLFSIYLVHTLLLQKQRFPKKYCCMDMAYTAMCQLGWRRRWKCFYSMCICVCVLAPTTTYPPDQNWSVMRGHSMALFSHGFKSFSILKQ